MTDTPRIFVTDCEGPVSRNDNAMEMAARFIPRGDELFARLSRYDDFLADVLHKPGYNAGDTLRLIAPFFVAFGVRDAQVQVFSRNTVTLVPGAAATLAEIAALMPTFIISTSYTPYIRALCDVVGLPFEQCHCTELSLDRWKMEQGEMEWLRDWASRAVELPLIEIPDGCIGIGGLTPGDRDAVLELDDLFWHQMAAGGCISGSIMAAVRPVGGDMKLLALEEIVAQTGVARREVMYVGDSITDAPPFAAVRRWGGASLSFNGNGYALAAAEYAAAAADTTPVLELARAFRAGGRAAVDATVREWSTEHAPAQAAADAGAPALPQVGVVDEAGEPLAAASAWARTHVRGEPIARLG